MINASVRTDVYSYTDSSTQNNIFSGWTVVGAVGNVGACSTHYVEGRFMFPARSGVWWLDLMGNTDTLTAVEQRVATTTGQYYVLRFFVGTTYDPNGVLGTTSTVNVLVNGSQVMSATNARGADTSTLTWRRFSVPFTVPASTATITFLNAIPLATIATGLTPFPSPQSLALLAE